MPATGLFRGRGHIVEALNDEAIETVGQIPPGVPAVEVYCGPDAAEIIAAMDACFDSGEPVTLWTPRGRLAFLPRWSRGRVIGVSGVLWPRVPLRQSRRPDVRRQSVA